ncbi:MAG: hypothetical protein QXI33_00185 [Candidatus Pacearchaeota archaeon]
MDSFIKKIFDKKADNFVHIQFQKFSRGEFKDRALINASKSNNKYNISTTYEFARELVMGVAELIPKGHKVKVSGAIISTRDLEGEISYKDKKQFMGVKQYLIVSEMSGEEILNLCNKLPTSFIGLSFSAGDTELKIKPKAPKSAKPSTSEKAPVPDFCKLKTSNEKLVSSLLFDIKDFKKVEIKHDFIISELKIPKDEKDPSKMRENTIRKGKIIRHLVVDGKKETREIFFEA